MSGSTSDRGRLGETAAADWLKSRGYSIKYRNYRTPRGEIDIVAVTGDVLVIVEVKSAHGKGWEDPLFNVTPQKAHRVFRAGQWLANKIKWKGDVRVDILGVRIERDWEVEVTHIEGIGLD